MNLNSWYKTYITPVHNINMAVILLVLVNLRSPGTHGTVLVASLKRTNREPMDSNGASDVMKNDNNKLTSLSKII